MTSMYMYTCVGAHTHTPVFVNLRGSPPILVVVEEGTCVALPTEAWWSFARLGLIVGQHKRRFCGRAGGRRAGGRGE